MIQRKLNDLAGGYDFSLERGTIAGLSDMDLLKNVYGDKKVTKVMNENGGKLTIREFLASPLLTKREKSLFPHFRELIIRDSGQSLGDQLVSCDCPDVAANYIRMHVYDSTVEVFGYITMDNRNRILTYEEISYGTINAAAVYPRVIVEKVLKVGANSLIFFHNHPSAVAEPSDTDVRLTRKLVDAMGTIDVSVYDHIIIGRGCRTSMVERGLM